MNNNDRDLDKKIKLYPEHKSGKREIAISKDVLKSAFIVDGLTIKELSAKYHLSEQTIQNYAKSENWVELRKSVIQSGLAKVQNNQLKRAQDILDLETSFKTIKIQQLQAQLEYFAAYLQRHGHLFKLDPVTGELLLNRDGMPVPLNLPNITNEIKDLKESINMSSGIKGVVDKIEEILKEGGEIEEEKSDVINVEDYTELFDKEEEE